MAPSSDGCPIARAPDAVPVLLWLVVLAIPFQRVWTLPFFGARLQPPEVVGLFVVAAAVWQVVRGRVLPARSLIDAGVSAWWLAVTVASVVGLVRGGNPPSTLAAEWMGVTYLVALYAALRVLLTRDLLRHLPPAFVLAALVAGVLGLAGVALTHAGVDTRLAIPAGRPFPYVGTAARAQAFTPAPAMLASILITGAFALAACRWPRHTKIAAGAVLGVALVATLSKAAVCLVVGALVALGVVRPRTSRGRRTAWLAAAAGLAVFYVAATHVAVMGPDAARRVVAREGFLDLAPLARVPLVDGPLFVYATNYAAYRRSNVAAIRTSWPWGLGPGGHEAFVRQEIALGLRDPAMRWTDPHSTYLGVAAEMGAAGLVGLSGLAVAVAVTWRRAWARAPRPDTTRAPVGRERLALVLGGLVAMALDATVTDVMNFRHGWVALAALASLTVTLRRPRGVR